MFRELEGSRSALTRHRLYGVLDTPTAVRTFMEHHVYAAWDFMSLLNALQRRLTWVELPRRPAAAAIEAAEPRFAPQHRCLAWAGLPDHPIARVLTRR